MSEIPKEEKEIMDSDAPASSSFNIFTSRSILNFVGRVALRAAATDRAGTNHQCGGYYRGDAGTPPRGAAARIVVY